MISLDSENKRIGDRGFTLIELLVVISIISLLSSVVLASLRTAREKAQIAASQIFAGTSYRKLGADLIFHADFNECTGGCVPIDNAGNFTTGGASALHGSLTPYPTGYSLNTPSGVTFSRTSAITAPSNKYTTSLWLNHTLGTYAFLLNADGTRYIFQSGGIYCWQNNVYAVGPATSVVMDGKWHHILCTFNGSTLTLYFDGKLFSAPVTPATAPTTFQNIYVAHAGAGSAPFTGYLDDVEVFSETLTASEVWRLYATGAAERGLAINEE